MRRIFHSTVALTAALSLAGCFLLPPQSNPANEILIGVLSSTSGSNAGDGVNDGAELAIEQLNAAGGLFGKQLALVTMDDQSSATKAPPKAQQLVNQGVVAIIGSTASSITEAVIQQVTKAAQVVVVSPASTSPALTNPAQFDAGGYFFRTIPSDALQGKALAKQAISLGYHTLGVINVDNTYGNGFASELIKDFQAQSGNTAIQVKYSESPAPKPSYSDLVVPLLQKHPDAIALIAYPGGGSQIIKDWITSGQLPKLPWLFGEALKLDSFIANVSDTSRLEGDTGTYPYSGGTNYQRFSSDFQARFKIPPGAYAENAYDAAALIVFAMAKAGAATRQAVKDNIQAVSAGPGTAITPGQDQFQKALQLLGAGQTINYDGASGPVDLGASGDVTSGTYGIWTVKSGKIATTSQVITP